MPERAEQRGQDEIGGAEPERQERQHADRDRQPERAPRDERVERRRRRRWPTRHELGGVDHEDQGRRSRRRRRVGPDGSAPRRSWCRSGRGWRSSGPSARDRSTEPERQRRDHHRGPDPDGIDDRRQDRQERRTRRRRRRPAAPPGGPARRSPRCRRGSRSRRPARSGRPRHRSGSRRRGARAGGRAGGARRPSPG